MARKIRKYRCAIYTRKSSEEGLEQEFNSLDAQHEACAAYIASQRHEGWELNKQRYDDGGISGGAMNRPALQQLLADIEANQIDTVVVYKVDRLTRALSDFAKIVEIFDAHDVSFVSVTQQFNTTTSMGRLTLNVLLSFAQFEREVTGERIRDKIAASKKKGMWMGGQVPLGYDAVDRRLVVNEAEADTVRQLFTLYRDQGTARAVQSAAKQRGMRTKSRRRSDGSTIGGAPFSRGHIYQILSNPLYVGKIRHKGKIYPGEHDSIIDRELWLAVQRRLDANRVNRRDGVNAKVPSPLAGLLFDNDGNRFAPSHAVKNGCRYRYYIQQLDQGRPQRIAASEIENVVIDGLCSLLVDRPRLLEAIGGEGLSLERHALLDKRTSEIISDLKNSGDSGVRLRSLLILERIVVGQDVLAIHLDVDQLISGIDSSNPTSFRLPISFKRRGVETKLVLGSNPEPQVQDPSLIRVVVQAYDWWDRLLCGEAKTAAEIAQSAGVERTYISRILRLAFLAPDIVAAILHGKAPIDLTAERLTKHIDLPLDWSDQRRLLGFEARQT